MKLKITIAVIFLIIPTIFTQTKDSVRTYGFINNFYELTLNVPYYLKTFDGWCDDEIDDPDSKHIVTLFSNDSLISKRIDIGIFVTEQNFEDVASKRFFVNKNNNWYYTENTTFPIIAEEINIKGWNGIKLKDGFTELDKDYYFGAEFFLMKKFKNKSVFIVGYGIKSNYWRTSLNKVLSDLSFSENAIQVKSKEFYKDIKEVDFYNAEYTLCKPEELQGYYNGKLKVSDSTYFENYRDFAKDYSGVYRFLILDIKYGDITGDGNDEATVLSLQNGGGTGWFTRGHVFTLENGHPKQMYVTEPGDKADGGIDNLEIKKGLLYVTRYDGLGGLCCPEYIYTISYKWDGADFIQQACDEEIYENVFSHLTYKDTLYSKELVKGTTFTETVKYDDLFLLELKRGQNLIVNVYSEDPKVDVFLVVTNSKKRVLNPNNKKNISGHCRDIRVSKINLIVPSDGFYTLRVNPEDHWGSKYKLTVKSK